MNLKKFKSFSLLLFTGSILLISCEKEKIISDANTAPEPAILPAECENCHIGTFPEQATNAHSKHTTGLYTFDCNTCHYGHGYETLTHMNATKNVTFNPNGLATRNGADSNTPTWDSTTKTCSNVYCHSNGITADRGTDGTYTWGTLPFGTVSYQTTPSWTTGKIDDCVYCHNGKGNMTSPYKVEKANTMAQTNYPASGSHQMSAHRTNSQEFSATPYASPFWDGVQCFWCHSDQATNVTSIDGPIIQGTYGTAKHVDGATFFKPLNISAGGTMAEGLGYSSNGNAAHCANGVSCW